jgi:hypothetical protein
MLCEMVRCLFLCFFPPNKFFFSLSLRRSPTAASKFSVFQFLGVCEWAKNLLKASSESANGGEKGRLCCCNKFAFALGGGGAGEGVFTVV